VAFTTIEAKIDCIDYANACCKQTLVDWPRLDDKSSGGRNGQQDVIEKAGKVKVAVNTQNFGSVVLFSFDASAQDAERFIEKIIDIGVAC